MTSHAVLSRPSAACPSDEQLAGLLQSDEQPEEVALVSHLNQCEDCRMRLEGIAADADEWQDVQRHLTAIQTAELPPLERLAPGLTASLKGATLDTAWIRGERGAADHLRVVPSVAIPTHIGPYQIKSVLGYGGMGIVYKGWDDSLRRHVAIKVINDATALRGESREEFRREARAVAAVRSPYVVAIYAIADEDTPPYLVMEYVPGESLEQLLQRVGPLPWTEAARIGSQVARGLAAAHAAGVIHRDIKPGNVLIEAESGHVRLGDFGLAHSLTDSHVTRQGCVRGTPEFISPEQAEGKPVTPQADLFSLGSMLYAALVGTAPFHADTPLAMLRKTIEETPRPLKEHCSDLPPGFDQLVMSLLSKRPDQRVGSASEVAEFLDHIIVDPKTSFLRETSLGTAKAPSSKSSRWAMQLGVVLALSVLIGLASFSFLNFASQPGENTVPQTSGELQAAAQPKDAKDDQRPAEQPPRIVAPTRVQIVSPEDVLKERIRLEKDQIELPRHPLLVRQYEGHKGPVSSFAIDPKQEIIISASGWPEGDRTVRVWDFKTGKELRQFETADVPQNPGSSGEREAPGEFAAITLSADATEAVTGSTGGAVCIWDVATGKLLRQFTKHSATVYAVTSDDEGRVLSGGRDQVARLWDLKTGNVLLELAGNRSHVRTTAISPDGKTALTGGLDKVVRHWNLTEPKLLHEFPQEDWVWSVKFMPSGKSAVITSGKVARIIDLELKTSTLELRGHTGTITSVDRSEDGRWIATSSYDRTVRLWSADTGKLVTEYTGHRDWVWKVAFTPDGEHVMSAGGGRYTSTGGTNKGVDFTLRLWKLPAAEPRVVMP
jgi:serine/threonine protein kinase/WD40 repeat protein